MHAERLGISKQLPLEAVIWAFGTKFRSIPEGLKFTVVTNNAAMQFIQTKKEPSARLLQGTLTLHAFDFKIVHKKGATHSDADFLSRDAFVINLRRGGRQRLKGVRRWMSRQEALQHLNQTSAQTRSSERRKATL